MSDKTSKDDLRKMYLAGTVSVPARLPGLAALTFESIGKVNPVTLVKARQDLSVHVTVTRTFFLEDIKVLWKPNAGCSGDLKNGKWFAGKKAINEEIEKQIGTDGFDGIVFVREDAQSLLETKSGLTAAENAEYFPPMPQDLSVNSYNLKKVGCLHDECCDYPGGSSGGGGGGGGGCCCCCCGGGGCSGGGSGGGGCCCC
ncbi:MAG: hypothetical protein R3C59_16250 [Planctomycetaceae bacterium]